MIKSLEENEHLEGDLFPHTWDTTLNRDATTETRCWSHFLISVHYTLLRILPGPLVIRFWQRFTLSEGGEELSGKSLADALVARPFLVPMAFVERVLAEVEPFLVCHRACDGKFGELLGEVCVRGFDMPAIILFAGLSQGGIDSGACVDSYHWLLWMKARILSLLAPSLDCIPIEAAGDKGDCSYLILNHNKNGKREFNGWDPQVFSCGYIEHLLKLNGIPCPGAVTVVASCVGPASPMDKPETSLNHMVAPDKVKCRRIGFRDFLSEAGIGLKGYPIPDCKVYLCEEDLYCRARRRVVMSKSAVYGAPFTILRLPAHDAESCLIKPGELFQRINRITENAAVYLSDCRKRHRKLMGDTPDEYVFTYDANLESISMNGIIIIGGLGAKILFRIVEDFVHQGKREFSNRELKVDPYVGAFKLRTNFEVRLARVLERLALRCPMVRIIRPHAGHFHIECRHPISLKVICSNS